MQPGAGQQLAEWRAVQRRRLDGALVPLGYYCLHGASTVDGGGAAIDHLVIGTAGSFLVVDRQCADEVRKGFDGRVWAGGRLLETELDAAHTAASELGILLGSHVSAVLAVHDAEVKMPPVVRGVYLLAGRDVPPLIEGRPTHRSPAEVAQVALRAKAVLSGGTWTEPVRQAGSRSQRVAIAAAEPEVPRSGWRSWFAPRGQRR